MTTTLDPRPTPAQVHAWLATTLSDSALRALVAVLTSDPNWRLRAVPGPTTWHATLRYSPEGPASHVHLVRHTPTPASRWHRLRHRLRHRPSPTATTRQPPPPALAPARPTRRYRHGTPGAAPSPCPRPFTK